jgi:hypothetical protein
MEKWLTKKNIVISGVFICVVGWVLNFFEIIDYDAAHVFIDLGLVFIVVAVIFSLFGDKAFVSLMRFAAWWVPFGIFISYGVRYNTGYFSFELFNIKLTAFTLLFMSFFLIAIKSWELKALDRGTPVNLWLKWVLFMLAFVASIALSIFFYGFVQ